MDFVTSGIYASKRVRPTCSRFNTAKSLSASRQLRGRPRIWELADQRALPLHRPWALTFARVDDRTQSGRAENESDGEKNSFMPVAGIDDPGRTNNSRIGITDAAYSTLQLV